MYILNAGTVEADRASVRITFCVGILLEHEIIFVGQKK
jgi:hypothetical protein